MPAAMRAAAWAFVLVLGLSSAVCVESRDVDAEEPYYSGCVDRVYARQREAALYELNINVERLQAAPTVLRRFQQGTRLALHLDERNLQAHNITAVNEMPSTDIIDLFDLPVQASLEEGWCTRILDIFGSLFFRRVVDFKFASKIWLDIDADLPVAGKMAERIFSSPSAVGWPEGDSNMDRFYKFRKTTMESLVKDREARMEANALAAHGKELVWEEMSAEFRGVMGDDEVKPMLGEGQGAGEKKKTKKKKKARGKKAKKAPPPAADADAPSKFISLDDTAAAAAAPAADADAAAAAAAAAAKLESEAAAALAAAAAVAGAEAEAPKAEL